jgi:predicted DNA binding CopG/RHH family protein
MSEAERRYYLRKGRGCDMKKGGTRIQEEPAEYYEKHGVLEEIEDKSVVFLLDADLRIQILEGKRMRRLQNISIKIDPAQILALKKLATIKSIPYQTLIRQWLAENIRKELHLVSK